MQVLLQLKPCHESKRKRDAVYFNVHLMGIQVYSEANLSTDTIVLRI